MKYLQSYEKLAKDAFYNQVFNHERFGNAWFAAKRITGANLQAVGA
jgi:hypothetical protein